MTQEQMIAGYEPCMPEVVCAATLVATITVAIDDALALERAARARRKRERYLSFEIQDFLAHAKAQGLSASFLRNSARYLRLLLLAANDRPVGEIKPVHLKRFRKVYRYWPKNARRKGFEYLTDSQILAVGKKEAAPPPSARQKILADNYVRGFFNWLVKYQRILLSPYALPRRRPVRARKSCQGSLSRARNKPLDACLPGLMVMSCGRKQ